MNQVKIGQLAASAGVGVETIRFYERKGLLERPPRPRNGYRGYDVSVADRIRFIRKAQELGFSLAEVGELLALRVDPQTSCGDVRARAEAKLADIEGKIRTLREMRRALRRVTETCSGSGPPSACPILDYMEREEHSAIQKR